MELQSVCLRSVGHNNFGSTNGVTLEAGLPVCLINLFENKFWLLC